MKNIGKISLNGEWNLTVYHPGDGEKSIPANVPGNVEFDLINAGMLPKNLFYGENVRLAENFEACDWKFSRIFDCPEPKKSYRLVFKGVDTLAEYFLNGEKIGDSDNMLIEKVIPLPRGVLKATNNLLEVKISSTTNHCNDADYSLRMLSENWGSGVAETAICRRPAHTYGWDIMPRAVSAGVFRDVILEPIPDYEFTQFFMAAHSITAEGVRVFVAYELKKQPPSHRKTEQITVKIHGKCGDSEFFFSKPLYFRADGAYFDIPNAKIWNPIGFGEPNLYDVTIEAWLGDRKLCEKVSKVGLRTVKLLRSDSTDGVSGKFAFEVNGNEYFVKGTNWVPLSPYHSADASRLSRALNLLKESGSNMVRCWGGNLYESDEFYDFLDENGILCWQDFSFGCTFYPQTSEFLAKVRVEAESVIERLRLHPCLALWAGDNENDLMALDRGISPFLNKINREILPECVYEFDKYRDYLPSSPYVSEQNLRGEGDMPENHLWGDRDYYKSDYYAKSKAHFISEIGYPACVNRASALKFLPEKSLADRHGHDWIFHSTDRRGNDYRINFLEKNVVAVFGENFADFDRFSRASQLVQAEAYKFFVEHARKNKPLKSGILLWNLLDGWPQNSESTVDYYFEKKAAFSVVERVNSPVLMLIYPDENQIPELYAVNDTLKSLNLEYSVIDAERGKEIATGSVKVDKNDSKKVCSLPINYSEKRLLFIEWKGDGYGFNHFITGYPTYEFAQFDEWYKLIENCASRFQKDE